VIDTIPSNTYAISMEVHLTDDQRAFIRNAVESGRLQSEEDAVRQAMLLWEERERRRAEILAAVDKSEASLARGEGRRVSNPEAARRLADDVKRRALKKLKTDEGSRR
jgi:putative addiction module CopG family antidote